MKPKTALGISMTIIFGLSMVAGLAIVGYWFPEEPVVAPGSPPS